MQPCIAICKAQELHERKASLKVEKVFMHSETYMQLLYARSERGTRARMFLSILGYSIMAMIAFRSGFTY